MRNPYAFAHTCVYFVHFPSKWRPLYIFFTSSCAFEQRTHFWVSCFLGRGFKKGLLRPSQHFRATPCRRTDRPPPRALCLWKKTLSQTRTPQCLCHLLRARRRMLRPRRRRASVGSRRSPASVVSRQSPDPLSTRPRAPCLWCRCQRLRLCVVRSSSTDSPRRRMLRPNRRTAFCPTRSAAAEEDVF